MKDKQTFLRMMPIKKSLSLERKTKFDSEGEELNAINDAVEEIRKTQMEILQRMQDIHSLNVSRLNDTADGRESSLDDKNNGRDEE